MIDNKIKLLYGKDASYRDIDGLYEVKTNIGNKIICNDKIVDIGRYKICRVIDSIVTLETDNSKSESALVSLESENIIKVHYGAYNILNKYIVVAENENRVVITDKQLNILSDIEINTIIKGVTDVIEDENYIKFTVIRYNRSFGSDVTVDKYTYINGEITKYAEI